MTYFCTVLTEEWKEALNRQCEPFRLLWSDALGGLHIVRGVGEGVEGVDVGFSSTSMKYSKLLTPLLRAADSPFTVWALCRLDPMASPVALDIFVNPATLQHSLAQVGTFGGESALVELLTHASKGGLLVRKQSRPPLSDLTHARKRRRAVGDPAPLTPAEVVQWMREREAGCTASVALPQFLDVPGCTHVFCLQEMVFVPRHAAHWSSTDMFGGLLVGERNTGKSEHVRQLLLTSPVTPPRACPPILRPVSATLLVVPSHLLRQWQELLTGVRVVAVFNKKTWAQCCTVASLNSADVVITTHQYFTSILRKCSVKHKSRVFAAQPDAAVAHMPVRLDWLWWRRVVVDEALELYLRHSSFQLRRQHVATLAPASIRSASWWGLQGGVPPDSLAMCALVDMLHVTTRVQGLHVCDTGAYGCCILTPPPRLQPVTMMEHFMRATLTGAQRQAYRVLNRAGVSPHALFQVCGGDLSPVHQFLTPITSWAAALPRGLKIMDDYMMSASAEVEFTWSAGDDAVDEEGGEEAGAPAPTRAELQTLMTQVLEEENSEVRERKLFFHRVATELSASTASAGGGETCTVCLTNVCDCMFVCGHLMCHECVVDLFMTAKQAARQELQEQGYECVDEGFLAPCPTCRWSLEPHEVFWVPDASPSAWDEPDKVCAVVRTLRPLLSSGRARVLMLCQRVELLHHFCEQLVKHDLACRVLSMQAGESCVNWAWFTGSGEGSRVLFVYPEQLRGMKLHGVEHVMLLHPVLEGVHARNELKRAVMQCVQSRHVHLYHFIVTDTLEEATVECANA